MNNNTMMKTNNIGAIPTALFEWSVVEPLFKLPHKLVPTAWAGHIPFLFCLFKIDRPRTFVELGVFNGASMIAACTASASYNTETICYGIDTWAGDEHAGHYDGDKIFDDLNQTIAKFYPPARLLRGTFDNNVGRFKDKTIDLLHIDGLHTYQAVKHDFETWLPKMSDRGIIIFHDTSVREREFGVWKLWEELICQYPSMEFYHSFGLGVLFVGNCISPATKELLLLWSENIAFREFFRCTCEHIGSILPSRYQDQINSESLRDAKEQIQREQSHQIWLNRNWVHTQSELEAERKNSMVAQAQLWKKLRQERRTLAICRFMWQSHNHTNADKIDKSKDKGENFNTVNIIRNSGLFDVDFYIKEYDDVRHQNVDPIVHYVEYGFKEGRWPNTFFDTCWYANENSAAIVDGLNPLLHYIFNWRTQNLDPNPYFSTEWYLIRHPDVALSGHEACQHFLLYGKQEGRDIEYKCPLYITEETHCHSDGTKTDLHYTLERDRANDLQALKEGR